MRRMMRLVELFAKSRERRWVLVITVNVAQQVGQLFESRRIDSAVLLQAVGRPRTKLIQIPSGFGYTDHGTSRCPRFTIACSAGKIFL